MRPMMMLVCLVVTTAQAAELVDGATARKKVDVAKVRMIDARDASEQSLYPIPGALHYDRSVTVTDKVVLVIADNDQEGLRVGQALEQRHRGLTALTLQGGYETLRTLRPKAGLRAYVGNSRPDTFTIPSDTCQTGPALHTYGDEQP